MNDNTLPPTPKEFWTSVWEEGVIRFHQQNYNAQMVHFFDSINLKEKSVLIPLAGKTKDILYFLEKGAHVTAVEFYEGAVLDFFKENNLSYTKEGNLFKGDHIHFYACDFFDLKSAHPFDVMYDRASQVVFQKKLESVIIHMSQHSLIKRLSFILALLITAGQKIMGLPIKSLQVKSWATTRKWALLWL